MAILRANQIRDMAEAEIPAKLVEIKNELALERGRVKRGGKATNSGRIKELKKTVARILTITHEKKLGIVRKMRERKKAKGG